MGMTVNATLLVQGVHFYIAYILFDKFLLRPVVTQIERYQKERRIMTADLAQAKKNIDQQEQIKRQRWKEIQAGFHAGTPDVHELYEIRPMILVEHPSVRIDTDAIHQYKKSCEQFLFNEVTDAS